MIAQPARTATPASAPGLSGMTADAPTIQTKKSRTRKRRRASAQAQKTPAAAGATTTPTTSTTHHPASTSKQPVKQKTHAEPQAPLVNKKKKKVILDGRFIPFPFEAAREASFSMPLPCLGEWSDLLEMMGGETPLCDEKGVAQMSYVFIAGFKSMMSSRLWGEQEISRGVVVELSKVIGRHDVFQKILEAHQLDPYIPPNMSATKAFLGVFFHILTRHRDQALSGMHLFVRWTNTYLYYIVGDVLRQYGLYTLPENALNLVASWQPSKDDLVDLHFLQVLNAYTSPSNAWRAPLTVEQIDERRTQQDADFARLYSQMQAKKGRRSGVARATDFANEGPSRANAMQMVGSSGPGYC